MNKKRTIHGIDLTAPGGIEALLNFHRGTFGDAKMMADGGDGDAGGEAGDTGAQEQAGEQGAEGEQQSEQKTEGKSYDESYVKKLRDEAAANRTGKNALEQQLAAIQKALNPDAKGDEKPDAAQLTKALADREADARQAKTELAVFRLAGKHGADPDALLDSRGFLAKLADLDPTKTADIEKAIKAAVTENPKLRAVQAAGASGADFTGGSGEKRDRSKVTLDGALSNHYGK